MNTPDILNRRLIFEIFIALVIGFFVAQCTIQTSIMETKWTKAFILGIIGMSGMVIIRDRENFFLYFIAFLLPIALSFHPIYISAPFRRPINGFQIRAFDIPFFFLMIFWIFRIIRDPMYKVRLHLWFTIPYLLIFGLCFTSLSRTSIHLAVKASVLFIVLKNWLIFLYLANNLKKRKTIYIIIGIILLSGVLQALIGMGQYVKGGAIGLGVLGEKDIYSAEAGQESVSRVGGTVGHPNKLALFLAMLLEVNIALFFIPTPGFLRFLLSSSFFIMFSTLILTYSRGGWASLILGGMINYYWCMAKKSGRKIIPAVQVVLVAGCVTLMAITLIDSVRKRIFEDDHGTGDIREPLKVIAWNIIRHNYWLGVGLNNYTSVIHKYDNTPEGASWHFPEPVHNEYLLIAAELGIPAMLIFIFLMIAILKLHISVARSRADPVFPYLSIGFFCGWVGWCFHHTVLYEYIFFSHNIWFYLGIIQAIKNKSEV